MAIAPASHATIIWQGGSSLPGYGTCPNGTINWQNDAQHGNVVRFGIKEVTDGNSERCEMAVARRLLTDGMTVYIGWKSRVSAPTTNTWNYILQLKCHGTNVANHPLTLGVGGGRLTLRNDEDINGTQIGRTVWSTPLQQGQWFSMMLKIRYSENRSVGYVKVWYNGEWRTLANGSTTHYGQTWDGSENNVHWGIYRRSSVNGPQTHDLYRPRIATTWQEAIPNG
ncbi:heparin lyase I family protein [Streptomyces sp. KR80]|uniref:heparin lyase I family protein n=1 Tax=Streptomyces sp. KR80 TaxID=3457426 RepID=UPI003FD4B530